MKSNDLRLIELKQRVENAKRYMDALNDLEIPPNGDDCNTLYDMIMGQPYRPPHERGR